MKNNFDNLMMLILMTIMSMLLSGAVGLLVFLPLLLMVLANWR
jgi:hypothetical protein